MKLFFSGMISKGTFVLMPTCVLL